MKIFYDVMDRRSVARLALAPALAQRLLAAPLLLALRQYAAQGNVTLNSIVRAGFCALLHRHTGQEQLELALRLSPEDAPEAALAAAGPSGSVLQLRSQLSSDTRLRQLLSLGLTVPTPEAALEPSAPHDLTAEITVREDTLVVQVEYNRDFFTAEQIERMLGHWEVLLQAIVTDPEQCVETVPLLTPAEYTQIVYDWNATAVTTGSDVCVHQLFEQQVGRTPHAIAAVCGAVTLTYQELDRRANRLAQTLQALGVAPDCPVSIFMDRSLEMITAVLAVLKAGGAYVPLDPAYPRDRLEWICADTQAPVMIAQRALADRLPATRGHVVLIDENWDAWEHAQPAAPQLGHKTRPEHLAYIIYTSGSTGRPKGICLPHRALTNLIHWHQRCLLGGVRTLQFASLNFDASFHELLAAWATGGTIYLITESLRRDVVALTHFIADHAIAKVILPVVVLQQMAEHFGSAPALLRCLQEVTTTGEQLQITGPIVRLFKQLPHCTLHNHYGPSETHVVTALTLPPDPDSWPAYPSIGRPIDNAQIYILDRLLHPVPSGVIGELYIGGVSLAREYLGRPDLTAERFIRDPFSTAAAARLYRTGDLVRHRPDGTIDFLGRIDHQVKIRGFRVELGEIEATLSQHPAVLEAVVLAREDTPGDKQLVAYVVLQPGWQSVTDALREFLATRLPDFMIPAAFVVRQELPLNANGKVDRKALPPPDRQRPELARRFVPPRTDHEKQLAAIFGQVLNLDTVGVDDDFFALGGDSLRAVKVLARIRQSLGAEVPFQALFSHPTVAALARAIAPYVAPGNRAQPIPVMPRTQRLPVSFAQERMWFLSRLAPDSPAYNCCYFYRLRGPLHHAALAASLRALVARHEALRTTFREVDGQLFQHIDAQRELVIETLDLHHLPQSEREAVVLQSLTREARRPLELLQGPLLRVGLYTLDNEDHVLWLVLHHIITDGRSMEVLLSELAAIYDAFRNERPFPLPPLSLQYADYAAWERQHLNEESLTEHIAYWKNKLTGAPPLIELPADHPRPATQSLRGAEVAFQLDRELTGALKKLGAEHQMTLTMVVLAGFAALLHRYTGQDELVLGIPSLGRDRVETESLVGFFVNALPVRLGFHGAPSFRALLQEVRTASLEALEHDLLPFERLVQELHVARDASYHPVIQIALAPQLQEERVLRLGGLRSERLTTTSSQAMFDLTLFLWEEAGQCAGAIEYSTDLFQHHRIARLVTQLQTLLASGAAQPESPVATLPILLAAERQQLITSWNPRPRRSSMDAVCLL
ncbi:MAG: amino acid adenylation domain-containing protein [Pseudoxanthomonas sp.]